MKSNIELLSEFLKVNHLTISSVESLTGGLFASSMTAIPGSSAYFKGAMVTYATEEKINLLQISPKLIQDVGVVSNDVAFYMARNGQIKLNSDICVSFTGNAGPDTMENKPCGLVYIGIAYPDEIKTYQCRFYGLRNEIRNQCIEMAGKLILEHYCKKN